MATANPTKQPPSGFSFLSTRGERKGGCKYRVGRKPEAGGSRAALSSQKIPNKRVGKPSESITAWIQHEETGAYKVGPMDGNWADPNLNLTLGKLDFLYSRGEKRGIGTGRSGTL